MCGKHLSTGGPEAAGKALADLVDRFGADRVSIELTHHGHPLDDERNAALAELAPKFGLGRRRDHRRPLRRTVAGSAGHGDGRHPGPQLDGRGGRFPCATGRLAPAVGGGDGAAVRALSRGGDGRGRPGRAVRVRAGADRSAVAAVRRPGRAHRGQLAAASGHGGRPQPLRLAGAGATGVRADRA